MSFHIEWDGTDAELTLYPRGSEFDGYDYPVAKEFGLLMGGAGGGALMVEGTREKLLSWLDRARAVVLAEPSLDNLP